MGIDRRIKLVEVTAGPWRLLAEFEWALSPRSCARLLALLPLRGDLLQARWSGEACWMPLRSAWSVGDFIDEESATGEPEVGEVLLYTGADSEPELLFPYGVTRFSCRGGRLRGNRVLRIVENMQGMVSLGEEIFCSGKRSCAITEVNHQSGSDDR